MSNIFQVPYSHVLKLHASAGCNPTSALRFCIQLPLKRVQVLAQKRHTSSLGCSSSSPTTCLFDLVILSFPGQGHPDSPEEPPKAELFHILTSAPHHLNLYEQRAVSVYRWRSKPEVASHESIVLQPWTSGEDPRPLDVYLRIHLVLESMETGKPSIIAQSVRYTDQMKWICDRWVPLAPIQDIMTAFLEDEALYGYFSGSTCVEFVERMIETIRFFPERFDLVVTPEHRGRQGNAPRLQERALVAMADMSLTFAIFDQLLIPMILLSLLQGPFKSLSLVYFGLVGLKEVLLVVAIATKSKAEFTAAAAGQFIKGHWGTIIRFVIMQVFLVGSLWLCVQNKMAVLGPLVTWNFVRKFLNDDGYRGGQHWETGEGGTCFAISVLVFRCVMLVILFLPVPWVLQVFAAVLCLVTRKQVEYVFAVRPTE